MVGTVGLINPHTSDVPWSRISAARLQPAMSLADDSTPARLTVSVNAAHADKFLSGSGHRFEELLGLVDAGKPLPTFPLPAKLEARVRVANKDVESQNVVGVLPGSDPTLKNEYVALSGHLDHLGVGGAVNGTRFITVRWITPPGSRRFLKSPRRCAGRNSGVRCWSPRGPGRRKGCSARSISARILRSKAEDIVADLNLDMFLPLFPMRIVTAVGAQESDLGDRLRAVAGPLGVEIQNDPEPQRNLFIRSDQYNFIRRGIPALAFKIGYTAGSPEEATAKRWLAERYHAPSDERLLAEQIANEPARPKWKADSFFRRFAQ